MPDRDEFAEGWGRGWAPTNAGRAAAGTALSLSIEKYPASEARETLSSRLGDTGWARSWPTPGEPRIAYGGLVSPGTNRAKEPFGWPRRAERAPFMRQAAFWYSSSNASGSSVRNHTLLLDPVGVIFVTHGADATSNLTAVTCTGYTFENALANVGIPNSGQGRIHLWVGRRDYSVSTVGRTVAVTSAGPWRTQHVLEVWGIRGEMIEFTSAAGTGNNITPTGVRSLRADEVFIGARHKHSGGAGPTAIALPYYGWDAAEIQNTGSGGLLTTAFARPMEVDGGFCQPTYFGNGSQTYEIFNSIHR